MTDYTPLDIATFWSKVEGSTPFQCWPWRGNKNGHGYGRFRGTMAHRVAYELVKGSVPEGQVVRHRCDNRVCCNPAHLEPGSQADNVKDAIERGRLAYGAHNGKTKLTIEQIIYLKENPDRKTIVALAKQFGVAKSTISYIRSGRSWKKVVGAAGVEPANLLRVEQAL